MKKEKNQERFEGSSWVGEYLSEPTFSTGADGLVEKPKRSFTDILEGFCCKKEILCLSTPHTQIWTEACEKAHTQTHILERRHWNLGRAQSLQ